MREELFLDTQEKEFLRKMGFTVSQFIISGIYEFSGYYNFDNEELVPSFKKGEKYIKDKYKVEIFRENGEYQVKEVGERIPNKHKFHKQGDNECCLGAFDKKCKNVGELINFRMFSYFYSNSFLNKYGYYPYGELAHGHTGIFQQVYYEDDKHKSMRLFLRNIPHFEQSNFIKGKCSLKSNIAIHGLKRIKSIINNNPLFTK